VLGLSREEGDFTPFIEDERQCRHALKAPFFTLVMNANRSDDFGPLRSSTWSERTLAERVDHELKNCLDHAAEGLH
jgi:hypothetical protein